jgi:dTDP-4-amino-4,6-dideoxygalactose transaminase
MTFCSTVHVIEHLGARPILVDVEPDTLNIDPRAIVGAIEKLEKATSGERVRAIMPVHLYGHPCDMDAILEIAGRYELPVVEDAAHALPAQYDGKMIGTLGTFTAFSFYATKNMTTAEGGMLTGGADLIERARVWSLHGMSRDAYKRYTSEGSWHYEVVVPGFKCNMTDIQASLGLQQLRKLEAFQARRRAIVAQYNSAFCQSEVIEPPTERPEVESAWHIYPIRLTLERLSIDRARFIEELKSRNIGASVHFIPIHLHAYYRKKYGYGPDDFPIAYREFSRLVSLPLHPRMGDQDVQDVIESVQDVCRQFRR